MSLLMLAGKFEGVKIYESSIVQTDHAITLPPFGIFVGNKVYQQNINPFLIKHEFGHILQQKQLGILKFYFTIGLPSLLSAIKASMNKNYSHQKHPVEVDANLKSYHYFNQPKNWPLKIFPIK